MKPTSVLAIVFFYTAVVYAAPPSLTKIEPYGSRRGQTVTITISGNGIEADAEILTPLPFERVPHPATEKAKQPSLKLNLKPDMPLGLYPIRVRTPSGLSNSMLFSVGDLPEVQEKDPNDALTAAQSVTAPVTINGNAGGVDQDYYRISGRKGQRLVAEVEAKRLGSSFDSALHVLDAKGRELAFNDDAPGLLGDSRCDLILPADGDYLLLIHDAKYQGGQRFYRLKLGEFQYADGIFPLGWPRGEDVEVRIAGGNLPQPLMTKVSTKVPAELQWINVHLPGSVTALPFRFAVSDEPEIIAPKGPNKSLKPGVVVNSQLEPGVRESYVLPVAPGQSWGFEVEAASLGSRLDAFISVTDEKGNRLAMSDDASGFDPKVHVRVPDGVKQLTLTVEDLHRRSGPGFAYRLRARPSQPDFALRVVPTLVNVPRHGYVNVPVRVTRTGYDGPIQLVIPEELEGINAIGGLIPAGADQGILTLWAEPTAPMRVFDLSIWGQGGTAAQPIRRLARPATVNVHEMADARLALQVPAAVTTAAPAFLKLEGQTVRMVASYTGKLKITADRQPNFDGTVRFTTQGLPFFQIVGGIGTISKGANEVTLTYRGAGEEIPKPGTFPLTVQAKATFGGRDEVMDLPPVTLQVVHPFSVEVLTPQPVKVRPGGKAKLQALVRRVAPFDGPVTMKEESGLPPQVTCTQARADKDASLLEFELAAGPAATTGEFDVVFQASTPMTGRKSTKDYVVPDILVRLRVEPAATAKRE